MSGEPRFLNTAAAIGSRLCRDAIWDGPRCNWLGWGATNQMDAWVPAFQACSGDLYEGTPGIALFLARLYGFTQDKHCRRTLEGAVNHALDRLPSIKPSDRLGYYTGVSGVAHSLVEIGRVLEHEPLIQRALGEMASLRDIRLDQTMIDVISGCAGCIPALLDVGMRFGRDDLVDDARRQGEFLLQMAAKSDAGWSWDTMQVPRQRHLLGYAHGAAGVITALLELHHVTGDTRFLEAGREGLRYERSQFDAQNGNWPDLRLRSMDNRGAPGLLAAWCHGAPGVGMSRVRCLSLLQDDAAIRDEIAIAIGTTRATLSLPGDLDRGIPAPASFGSRNYSLCHGMGGNAELMIMASQEFATDEPSKLALYELAANVGVSGIEHFEQFGRAWPCGTTNCFETPNLMTGTAGIGYFYLRLYDPAAVPSILVLNPGSHEESVSSELNPGELP